MTSKIEGIWAEENEALRRQLRELEERCLEAEARADELERLATEAFDDLIEQLLGFENGAEAVEVAETVRDDFASALHPGVPPE